MLTGCTVRGSRPNIPSELEFAAIFVAGGAARVRALGRGMLECGNTRALSFAKTRSPRFETVSLRPGGGHCIATAEWCGGIRCAPLVCVDPAGSNERSGRAPFVSMMEAPDLRD